MAERVPLIPFRMAARQHYSPIGSVPYQSGAKLQALQISPVGWLAALIVQVKGTATGGAATATYVNATEQAFNLISRFRLDGNGGNINAIDMSGWDAYLESHFYQRGYKLDAPGVGSSAVDPTLIKTPLTTVGQVVTDFTMTYVIPINANQGLDFDTGLLLMQSQDASFYLNMDTPPTSSIYATNPPVFSAMNVNVGYLWYEHPDPGRVALPRPLLVRTLGQDTGLAVVNGENKITIGRQGTLMHAIIVNKVDGAYDSTKVDELQLKLNLNPTPYVMKGYENRLINRLNLGVDLPAGVNAFDFYHAFGDVSGGDSRDMFDLEQYSTFQIISKITGMSVPATSNLRIITRTLQQLTGWFFSGGKVGSAYFYTRSNFRTGEIMFKNKMLLLIVAAQLSAFGQTLQVMDSDNKGNDDIAGTILRVSGNALNSYAANDDKGFKKYLKLIADSIYDFLGLTAGQPGGGSLV
jgi:hypothetical protein